MARTGDEQKNKKRAKMIANKKAKRSELKKIIMNKSTTMEDRFDAVMRLAKMPRNSAEVRYQNRCELTGRAHSVYRKFKLGRVILRDLASFGQIPGMTKSSW
jgi:small subunit ribosomal protein S14